MFGRAVYVSQFDGGLPDDGCDFYFTSFHIAEEFNDEFAGKAAELLRQIKANGREVIVDMSPRGLEALGFESLKDFVQEFSVDYIRFDFGFTEEEIIEASEYCGVAVNASTADAEFLSQLKGKVLAIHNYYPRPETGLDSGYFRQKNKDIRSRGIKIGAYIAGDENLRGPLYEGLPTLEMHRHQKPYVQFEQLRREVDYVIVGDGGLSEREAELICKAKEDGILRLPCILDDRYEYLYDQVLTNRPDSPNWLCRVMESRQYATFGQTVEPRNCAERTFGSITVDNERYLRYSGEIQIMKANLPQDDRVNVIGNIDEEYLPLLRHLTRGCRFMPVHGSVKEG